MALELGSGYVTLLPSARGFGAKARAITSRELKGAGTQAGTRFSNEMTDSSKKAGGRFAASVKTTTDEAANDAAANGKAAGSRFGSAMKTGALAGLAGFGLAAGVFMKNAVNQASKAQQGDGAIEAILGQADSAKVKKMAEKAGAELGLSYSEYVNQSATNMAFLKNKGFVGDDLVKQNEEDMKRAADLAAQYEGTTAEALNAIVSARKGESDPIERYGISLNEHAVASKAAELGLKKVNGQYTEADKLTARNAIMTQQSADANGAAAREADTYAGAQMRAKAAMDNLGRSVGEALLPVLSRASIILKDVVVPAVSGFVQGMKDGTGAGGQFVDFFKRLQPFLVPAAAALGAAATAFAAYRLGAIAARIATQLFSGALKANPIGLVITAIGLLVGALVWLYRNNETARAVMDKAWAAIRTAVSTAWNGYIKPALAAMGRFIRDVLAPAAVWLWKNIIVPAFVAIGAAIKFAWNVVIKPVLGLLFAYIKYILAPVVLWLWQKIIAPAFQKIGAVIKAAWTSVIKPVLGKLSEAIKAMPGVFDKAQKGIATAWSKIKAAALKPVEFVVQTVLNQGLIKGLKGMLSILGLGSLEKKFDYIPWNVKLARGGPVPGYSSSDTADNIPAMLTADEFVTRRASARKMRKKHPGALEYINQHGELPRYARGGWAQPWPMAVGTAAKRLFPGLRSVGGYGSRAGKSDHSTGNALDFMVPDSSAVGDAIAAWGIANHKAMRLKYIIWKKQIIGSRGWDGWSPYTRYGSSKNRTLQHYDHPHFSFEHGKMGNPGILAKALSPDMIKQLMAGGAGLLGDMLNPFDALRATVEGTMKKVPGADTLMGQTAGGMVSKVLDGLSAWTSEKYAAAGGGSAVDSAVPGVPGAGVTRWADTVRQALTRAGLPTSDNYVQAWLRQIKSESGGDPNVAQRIRDRNGTGASAGMGLVQVIPGTFNAYRDRSLPNNRRDPLANLTAGMRYAKSRYKGRMLSVIGHGHGYAEGGDVKPTLYDSGGILSPGLTLVSNQTNKPETVRTYEQERRMQDRLASSSGANIVINGLKYDAVPEMVEALDFALTRRDNRARYGG